MAQDTPKKNREFGVILEDIDSNVQHIVEAVDTHTKQLARLEKRVEKLDTLKDDVAVIKATLEGTEMEKALKQRVGDLEKRTDTLEAKAH